MLRAATAALDETKPETDEGSIGVEGGTGGVGEAGVGVIEVDDEAAAEAMEGLFVSRDKGDFVLTSLERDAEGGL